MAQKQIIKIVRCKINWSVGIMGQINSNKQNTTIADDVTAVQEATGTSPVRLRRVRLKAQKSFLPFKTHQSIITTTTHSRPTLNDVKRLR